jgi:hypothetical protein
MEAHYTTRIREDLERDGSTFVSTAAISDNVARSRIRNAAGWRNASRVRTEKDDYGIVGWLEDPVWIP